MYMNRPLSRFSVMRKPATDLTSAAYRQAGEPKACILKTPHRSDKLRRLDLSAQLVHDRKASLNIVIGTSEADLHDIFGSRFHFEPLLNLLMGG